MLRKSLELILFTSILAMAPSALCQSSASQGSLSKHHHHHSDNDEGFPDLQLEPNAPMWQRYLVAAEAYRLRKDEPRAKAYYLEALRQLEAVPPTSRAFSPRLGMLEVGLLSCYPQKSADPNKQLSAERIKTDEEEVAVLARIHRLDQIYVTPTGTNLALTDSKWREVAGELSKNKALQQASAGTSK